MLSGQRQRVERPVIRLPNGLIDFPGLRGETAASASWRRAPFWGAGLLKRTVKPLEVANNLMSDSQASAPPGNSPFDGARRGSQMDDRRRMQSAEAGPNADLLSSSTERQLRG